MYIDCIAITNKKCLRRLDFSDADRNDGDNRRQVDQIYRGPSMKAGQ